jgi:glycosyltransferase involved in cell wall biosynthesis
VNPSKRIRVLLTVPHLSRTQSPYREMMAIARHINRDDFDLTICALRNGGFEETGPVLDKLGIPWFVTIFRSRNRSLGELKVVFDGQNEMARRGPFDIQHSLDFTSNPTEAIGARIRSRRYVYNQRNMNENGHPPALRMKFRFSNRIVAIANHVREFLLEQGAPESKIVKIFNGIDLEDADREIAKVTSEPGNLILVLGQIEPRKRHQDIIKAMPMVLAKHPEVKLALAGNVYHHEYLAGLKKLVSELNLTEKVEFLGPRNDVPELMRQSKAIVLASESEGLPWVILEAMAARLPFVGSNIGAHSEVIENGRTGLLSPLGNPAGYAASLDQLLSDPEFAARIGCEGRAAAERNFSAVGMVRNTERLYRDMMGTPNPQLIDATQGASA